MTDLSLPALSRTLRRTFPRRGGEAASLFGDPVAVGAINALLVLTLSSVFLARSWMAGLWMELPHADVEVVDFAAFWASAKAVLAGHAAQAYDWANLRVVLEHASGHPVPQGLPIYYPPAYLLLIAPLGWLPYRAAFLVWMTLGVGAYAAALRLASRRRAVMIVGLAGVGVFSSLMVGQNGVFTAALLGAGLALADRRPVLAGVLLGLLCYKPQLAVIAPVALVAGGRWRTLAVAAATAALLTLAAGLALGWDAYAAFFAASARARTSFVGHGWLPWGKVQTVYGALREAHVAAPFAFAAAGVAALTAAGVVAWLWRSGARPSLRVAAACAGAYLSTPYAFAYDSALLGMATAFLLADVSKSRRLTPVEMVGLMAAFLAPFQSNPWPTVAPSAAILLAIAAWRARPGAGVRGITEISRHASHPHATVAAS